MWRANGAKKRSRVEFSSVNRPRRFTVSAVLKYNPATAPGTGFKTTARRTVFQFWRILPLPYHSPAPYLNGPDVGTRSEFCVDKRRFSDEFRPPGGILSADRGVQSSVIRTGANRTASGRSLIRLRFRLRRGATASVGERKPFKAAPRRRQWPRRVKTTNVDNTVFEQRFSKDPCTQDNRTIYLTMHSRQCRSGSRTVTAINGTTLVTDAEFPGYIWLKNRNCETTECGRMDLHASDNVDWTVAVNRTRLERKRYSSKSRWPNESPRGHYKCRFSASNVYVHTDSETAAVDRYSLTASHK